MMCFLSFLTVHRTVISTDKSPLYPHKQIVETRRKRLEITFYNLARKLERAGVASLTYQTDGDRLVDDQSGFSK